MNILQFDPEIALRRHIYNYMVKRNFHVSAELFKEEADIPIEPSAIDDSPLGFLWDWWSIFWDVYNARATNHGLPESFIKESEGTEGKNTLINQHYQQFEENIGVNKESSPPSCDICKFYKFYELWSPSYVSQESSPPYVSQEASSSRTPTECYRCLELLRMLELMSGLTSVDVNNNYYVEPVPSTYGATDGGNQEFKGTPTRCYDWDELSVIFKQMGESTSVDVTSYNNNVESLPSTNGATDGENQCYGGDELSVMFKPRSELTGADVNSQNYDVESLPPTEGAPDGETHELKLSDV